MIRTPADSFHFIASPPYMSLKIEEENSNVNIIVDSCQTIFHNIWQTIQWLTSNCSRGYQFYSMIKSSCVDLDCFCLSLVDLSGWVDVVLFRLLQGADYFFRKIVRYSRKENRPSGIFIQMINKILPRASWFA